MSMQSNDKDLERAAADALKAKTESLDAQTLSRLNQARQRALGELGSGRQRNYPVLPLAGASAAGVVLAMVLMLRAGDDTQGIEVELQAAVVDDFELLMAEDGIEILEDLEFYELLDTLQGDDDGASTIG